MDEKTVSLINKFKNNHQLAENLLNSQDGQQLFSLLTGNDGGSRLERAAKQASAGNTAELSRMLSDLMKSPQGAAVMRRISEQAKK